MYIIYYIIYIYIYIYDILWGIYSVATIARENGKEKMGKLRERKKG